MRDAIFLACDECKRRNYRASRNKKLKTEKLDVPAGCTAAYIGFNIHFAKIGEAKLTAKYER